MPLSALPVDAAKVDAIAPVSSPPDAPSVVSSPTADIENLRREMRDLERLKDFASICKIYIKNRGLSFSTEDNSIFLRAFTTKAKAGESANFYMHNAVLDLCAYFMDGRLSSVTRSQVIKAYRYYRRTDELHQIHKSAVDLYKTTPQLFEDMLDAMVFCGDDASALRIYQHYRDRLDGGSALTVGADYVTQEDWPLLGPYQYLGLAQLLCIKGNDIRGAQILRDMDMDYQSRQIPDRDTAHAAVSSGMAFRKACVLLATALTKYDAAVIEILVKWFHTQRNSPSGPIQLDDDLVQAIFEGGCAMGRPDILRMTAEILDVSGIRLTAKQHTHLVIAACRFGDMLGAIEYLIAAESAGVDFMTGRMRHSPNTAATPSSQCGSGDSSSNCGDDNGTSSCDGDANSATAPANDTAPDVHPQDTPLCSPRYIQESLAKVIRRPADIDTLYFALLDLKSSGTRPPLLALNALITAAGLHNRLDRSFAMIQELEPIFNTKPNALTFYALLGSVVQSRHPRVEVMLTILQEMDDAGYTPDGDCFSVLLEGMLLAKDLATLQHMLEHIKTENLRPRMRCLRRLALHFERSGQREVSEDICELMKKLSGSTLLPAFFRIRLATVREEREKGKSNGDTRNGAPDDSYLGSSVSSR